ncbi:hypothetical protein GLW05_11830 [Pontibacillus yanchengensis]|uniref:Metal-dependent hydrolase n=1 Tax=Pontibacillus yanchengensis TaxID=462910 RepID=A0A6I5A0I7_9BACI|nr:metal-dependent hydrolase [Pontibacillus yanchengensis]MYL34287.1 hypothetical protein [Pontibacillus yanchengensis]
MGDLVHVLLHFLVGASISYLLFNKDFVSISKRLTVYLFGGIVAVSPDIPKFFGYLFGHSIFYVLLMGLCFTPVFRIVNKDFSFWKTWIIFSITVLIGHIYIDYIGNGIALLFPIVKKDFNFHIIPSLDLMIITTLFTTLIIGLFHNKSKGIILLGALIISLYFCLLTASKIQLEHTLREKFNNYEIELLLTYPNSNDFGEWSFQVRTNEFWVRGSSSIYKSGIRIKSERDADS